MIPVRLPPMEVHIHADRRLAFQVITAFGASVAGAAASSRVLSREGRRLLVEFHTPAPGLLGGRKVYRTVEWVTPREPEAVEFETVEGPLSMMRDGFTLQAEGGCTRLRYESEFGIRGGVVGWLISWLYVRPRMRRLMGEHLRELKETVEARARRSLAFPLRPCDLDPGGVQDAA